MDYEEVLENLEDVLNKSLPLPLSGGKRIVDIDEIHDIIDEMRMSMPAEIKKAKAIIKEKEEILEAGKRDANLMIKRAEEMAKKLIREEEIYRVAEIKAKDLQAQANEKARELRNISYEYAEDILKEAEEAMVQVVNKLRSTKQNLKKQDRA